MIEPDIFRPGSTVGAKLSGIRSARAVDFTKIYPHPPQGYENPVDYVGQLSADGLVVTGVWSLLDLSGTFEMHREQGASQTQEAETVETVPASGMLF
ncbi:hypothetical protein P8Q88_01790 [Qipengyuania sp. XHP0207]|uniref:hypothetical protein n=1 Tax=Qipengyuania sp. XHP0207 TaxID=3038078 RepID=UPI00241EF3CA|nr:hypothetical protein [Qipengyuania sp. XHP0207]MDG5746897.1 hypothetical protein [Qipengyuania sp. XHP0207]